MPGKDPDHYIFQYIGESYILGFLSNYIISENDSFKLTENQYWWYMKKQGKTNQTTLGLLV